MFFFVRLPQIKQNTSYYIIAYIFIYSKIKVLWRTQTFLDNCILYCQAFFYPLEIKLSRIATLEALKIENRISGYTKKIQYNASQINSKMSIYVPEDAHCLLSIVLDDLYPTTDVINAYADSQIDLYEQKTINEF